MPRPRVYDCFPDTSSDESEVEREPDVPDGWTRKVSSTGRLHYENNSDGTFTLTRPDLSTTLFDDFYEGSPGSHSSGGGGKASNALTLEELFAGWTIQFTSSGRRYYENGLTESKTWDRPGKSAAVEALRNREGVEVDDDSDSEELRAEARSSRGNRRSLTAGGGRQDRRTSRVPRGWSVKFTKSGRRYYENNKRSVKTWHLSKLVEEEEEDEEASSTVEAGEAAKARNAGETGKAGETRKAEEAGEVGKAGEAGEVGGAEEAGEAAGAFSDTVEWKDEDIWSVVAFPSMRGESSCSSVMSPGDGDGESEFQLSILPPPSSKELKRSVVAEKQAMRRRANEGREVANERRMGLRSSAQMEPEIERESSMASARVPASMILHCRGEEMALGPPPPKTLTSMAEANLEERKESSLSTSRRQGYKEGPRTVGYATKVRSKGSNQAKPDVEQVSQPGKRPLTGQDGLRFDATQASGQPPSYSDAALRGRKMPSKRTGGERGGRREDGKRGGEKTLTLFPARPDAQQGSAPDALPVAQREVFAREANRLERPPPAYSDVLMPPAYSDVLISKAYGKVDKRAPESAQQRKKRNGEVREIARQIGVNSWAPRQEGENMENVKGVPPQRSRRQSKMKEPENLGSKTERGPRRSTAQDRVPRVKPSMEAPEVSAPSRKRNGRLGGMNGASLKKTEARVSSLGARKRSTDPIA